MKKKASAEKAIRDIRRATRRRYSAVEKIRIVLEGLRGESSIAEPCRKKEIREILYCRWSDESDESKLNLKSVLRIALTTSNF